MAVVKFTVNIPIMITVVVVVAVTPCKDKMIVSHRHKNRGQKTRWYWNIKALFVVPIRLWLLLLC